MNAHQRRLRRRHVARLHAQLERIADAVDELDELLELGVITHYQAQRLRAGESIKTSARLVVRQPGFSFRVTL